MATAAAASTRNNLIFDPFPLLMDPKDPDKKKSILSPHNKDFAKLNEILKCFPSVEKMCQAKDFVDMKTQLDKSHPYAYPLLQWIISSNRSHIVKLSVDKHVKSMVTPHQYVLLSAAPEKEVIFRESKAKNGSCFAYHGSSIENWHSIMRVGLKNASGTSLQVNGAAYGSGIYVSPQAATSFGYSKIGYGYGNTAKPTKGTGNRFIDSTNIYCIAICEIINKDIRKSGNIWVVPNPDHVVTRFFFVYSLAPGETVGTAMNCSTEDTRFVKEIEHALAV